MKTMFFFIAMFISIIALHGQELPFEKTLYYFLKLYGSSDGNYDRYIVNYGQNFDFANFKNAQSDEFERGKYINKVRNILTNGVKNIKFTDKFVLNGSGKIGEYNFEYSCFPITYWDWERTWGFNDQINGSSDGDFTCTMYKRNIINLNYFHAVVNMKAENANVFIKSRKNSKGNVNREIYFKLIYSIMNKTLPHSEKTYDFLLYCHSIEVFADPAMTKKIATLAPVLDYYDKIRGIKYRDTTEIIYFKDAERQQWNNLNASVNKTRALPSSEGAKYYRTIKYENGKITEVNDYYISGKIEMTGTFSPYCISGYCANGLFTWYYENGFKRYEVNIENGKLVGCIYKWDEQGKCLSYNPSNKYIRYTEEEKDCKCTHQ